MSATEIAEKPALSPIMDQYLRMKQSLPGDVWLFFRLGDFYGAFFGATGRAFFAVETRQT